VPGPETQATFGQMRYGVAQITWTKTVMASAPVL